MKCLRLSVRVCRPDERDQRWPAKRAEAAPLVQHERGGQVTVLSVVSMVKA
ncbi:hypothetical protein H4W81_008678 [Nonomuraea africana]|uniref:Uncharacterized protein n=1 Tax=Nonomuraea africana TaxID=46171 RepID=A0ABR9KV45_9ACTN|nr:hypothetical protein [Nonomuraea africana]